MAANNQTPQFATQIYVILPPVTYGLSPKVFAAYTNLGVADEVAGDNGFTVYPTVLYHNHEDGVAAASDDSADGEPEPEPEIKKTKTAKKDKAAKGEGAAKKVSKRTAVPEGQAQSLVDQTCMLAGTLHHMDHKTFTQAVKAYGGTYTSKLAEANFLVVGANPGKKVDEAALLGVSTIDEESFFDAIGADYLAPPAKKAKK